MGYGARVSYQPGPADKADTVVLVGVPLGDAQNAAHARKVARSEADWESLTAGQ